MKVRNKQKKEKKPAVIEEEEEDEEEETEARKRLQRETKDRSAGSKYNEKRPRGKNRVETEME